MNNTLSESWRDEELSMHPMKDQLRPGEGSGMNQIVLAFLRNDQGFAREEISDAIDMALRNEAMDLITNKRQNDELVEQWDLAIDAAYDQGEDEKAHDYETKRELTQRAADQEYEQGREDFAEALTTARRSGKVLMELDTCRVIVELDHDGQLSVMTETDIPTLYGVNPDYQPMSAREHTAAQASSQRSAATVDFSRGVTQSPRQRESQTQQQQELTTQRQAAAQASPQTQREGKPQPVTTQRTGMTHVSTPLNDVIARLRRGEPDPSYEAEQEGSQGPELG